MALIADLRVDLWLANTDTIRRIVAALIEERPAAVLLGGDFLYHPGADASAVIHEVVVRLRPLGEAGIPTYAVLGNHDAVVDELDVHSANASGDTSWSLRWPTQPAFSAAGGHGWRILSGKRLGTRRPPI